MFTNVTCELISQALVCLMGSDSSRAAEVHFSVVFNVHTYSPPECEVKLVFVVVIQA